jgi:Kef-type K+ transport system membrane component KefB
MEHHIPALLVVVAAAALAPMIGEATRRFGVSVVVIELLLGVLIGPQGLEWAEASTGGLPFISLFGMAFLFFIAGMEIDLSAIQNELKQALLAWLAAFAVAVALALALRSAGLVESWLVVAIALPTTALGVLVPILKDANVLGTPFGRSVMAAGVIGELGPIIAMSLTLSTRNTVDVQAAFTLAFIAIVVAVYWASSRVLAPGVMKFLRSTMLRSGQLPVRLAMLLLVMLSVLAEELGIDLALGALAAGMIVGLALRDATDHTMHLKLEAIGFGFFVPIFFIASGMKLDVASIFGSSHGLTLLAATFVALIAVRLPGVWLYQRVISRREAAAHGLFSGRCGHADCAAVSGHCTAAGRTRAGSKPQCRA